MPNYVKTGTDEAGQKVGMLQDGTVEVIAPKLTKADKPSVDEQQAGYHAANIGMASRQMKQALDARPEAAKPELISQGLSRISEPLGNLVRSPERQVVQDAQRNALDSILWLATGAAYNKEQMEGALRSHFPQIGDKTANVEAKRLLLKSKIDAARVRAGRANPQVNDVLDKFERELLGGQPQAPSAPVAPALPQQATGEVKRRRYNPATGRIE